jgi:hypothetical protein
MRPCFAKNNLPRSPFMNTKLSSQRILGLSRSPASSYFKHLLLVQFCQALLLSAWSIFGASVRSILFPARNFFRVCDGAMPFSSGNAVRFGAAAVSFTRCHPPLACCINEIFGGRSKKQMLRVHARRSVALVADEQSARDFSKVQFPRDTVRQKITPSVILYNTSVASTRRGFLPKPALVFLAFFHGSPKAFGQWLSAIQSLLFHKATIVTVIVLSTILSATAQEITRDDLKKTIAHIQELAKSQNVELTAAQDKLTKAQSSLTVATTELSTTKKALDDSKLQISKLDVDIANMKAWGIKWQNDALDAQKKLAVISNNYYKLKIFFSGVVGLIAGILCFLTIGRIALNPLYRVGIAVVTAIVFGTLTFILV